MTATTMRIGTSEDLLLTVNSVLWMQFCLTILVWLNDELGQYSYDVICLLYTTIVLPRPVSHSGSFSIGSTFQHLCSRGFLKTQSLMM